MRNYSTQDIQNEFANNKSGRVTLKLDQGDSAPVLSADTTSDSSTDTDTMQKSSQWSFQAKGQIEGPATVTYQTSDDGTINLTVNSTD
jgi:hypothetical protein